MKVTEIQFSRTIPTGNYANLKIGATATVDPTEAPYAAMAALVQFVDRQAKVAPQEPAS